MNEEVINQLAAVRETGAVNMLDKSGVMRVATECDFQELREFCQDASNEKYMNHLQEMGSR